jgi:Matrixin
MRLRALLPFLTIFGSLWVGCSPSHDTEVVKTDQAAATAPGGYCRSTTCSPGKSFQPRDGMCEPPGWPQSCGAGGVRDVPLWWRNRCFGYSMQKDGGKHVSFDEAAKALNSAFLAWTSRACPGSGTGPSHPSIDVRDVGPVACNEKGYASTGANQNVVIFRDELWPYKKDEGVDPDKPSPTIALTTVTFDTHTGEIFDADMELNTADHNIKPYDGVVDPDGYDLQAVLTHEVGHMFGLAHSPSPSAVMFASDEGHDIRKRNISLEDVAGICAIYAPNGQRAVAATVDASGFVAGGACDPTPRRGLSSACVHDPTSACSLRGAPGASAPTSRDLVLFGAAAAFCAVVRRRRDRRAVAIGRRTVEGTAGRRR